MGSVWMAKQDVLGSANFVAIKLLNPGFADHPQSRQMFLDEIRISVSLRHSHVVQVHTAGEQDGICYLVMEWVDGVDLNKLNGELWKRGELLPLTVSVYIVEQLLLGLEYAHGIGRSGVIHRDISPQNVLLSVVGEVKLTDFGVARLINEATSGDYFKGKARYSSRERLDLKMLQYAAEPTVDLFAVGAILEELITGRRFRDGIEGDTELRNYITEQEPSPAPLPGLPAQINTLRLGLLEPDPRRRIQTARAALEILRSWPDYQNASFQLREIVKSVKPPPSETPAWVDEELFLPQQTSASSVTAISGQYQLSNSKVSTSRTPNGISGLSDMNMTATIAYGNRRLAALFVATLGLLIGAAGTGYAFALSMKETENQLSGEEESPTAQVDRPGAGDDTNGPAAQQSPSELSDGPAPAEAPKPEPSEGLAGSGSEQHGNDTQLQHGGELVLEDPPEPEPLPPEPDSEVEIEKTPTPPEPKAPQEPKPKLPPVAVTFVAGDWNYAEIRVSGKKYSVDPNIIVKLPPGRRHKVDARKNEDDPWTKLGHVDLSSGKPARVFLRTKPPRLEVRFL